MENNTTPQKPPPLFSATGENGHGDTVVIGGSQAGLSVSYFLKQRGVEHLILEKSEIGARWRNMWDSFTLVTPNSMNNLPEFPSSGDPNGYLKRDDVIKYLKDFAESIDPPVRLGEEVTSIVPDPPGFRLETTNGSFKCRNVVVATGTFQYPNLPLCSGNLPPEFYQIHSHKYRSPAQLPEGAVLVVGSGQSGTQITDELLEAGRKVYLSVSSAVRIPRRYRGRDIMEWLQLIGLFERTVDLLDSRDERFAAHPHVSGRDGGRTLNLRNFGRNGVNLLGKVQAISGDQVHLTSDLEEHLRNADEFAADVCEKIDDAIEEHGIKAPPPQEEDPRIRQWKPPEIMNELSLNAAGIRSVIWATGYRFDFSWIKAPVLDEFGYPEQQKGITSVPGLYFAGMHWLHKQKSGLLYGVAEDAEHVARHIADREKTATTT